MNLAFQLAKDISAIPMHSRSSLNQAGALVATADFEDRAKHGGMTSAEDADHRARVYNEQKAADDLRPWTEDAPPKGAHLKGWRAWVDQLQDELDSLHSAAERLRKHVAAPEATQRSLTEAVAIGARRMLASVGIGTADPEPVSEPTVSAAQLDARLAAEKRASLEATAALEIVNAKIAVTTKRLDAVKARADEFVKPALKELSSLWDFDT